jgi:CHASE3 domain sensor protein
MHFFIFGEKLKCNKNKIMPSLSKYTQWKVIGGYSLLFLLSILAAVLIYKQIIELIVSEENSDNPNRKLFIIGNTITGLYESEGLGNAFVQTGSRSYFLKYRDLIEEVESNIDSLRDLTTRLDQILRLDTINDLLDQKIRNLQDIVRVKQSFVPDDFYNKAIASIESGRDSLQGTDIRKRHITTVTRLSILLLFMVYLFFCSYFTKMSNMLTDASSILFTIPSTFDVQ